MSEKSFLGQLFSVKSFTSLEEQSERSELKRTLGPFDLTLLGIGGIIGAGIFVVTGQVAAVNAGPAVLLSFVFAGIAAATAALSYAELSSMIPIAGSAYTYAYATLGELVAWFIGWDLILEYMVGAAAVSVGWSGYLVSLIQDLTGSTELSPAIKAITTAPLFFDTNTQAFGVADGAIVNLPAVFISLLVTLLLVVGISESARFNAVMVIIKMVVILIFIFSLIGQINSANYSPFIPENTTGEKGKFGWSGVLMGATVVFFAYIGFDAVSTTAQEAKNPQRDLPIGIIGSLVICTTLYMATSAVAVGVVNYKDLAGSHPLSDVAQRVGWRWLSIIIGFGAVAGLSSVMMISLLGQPRIFYSMAEDGLLPAWARKIHPRFKTPYVTTILAGTLCALLGGFLPIDVLAELTSIGTLSAFIIVNLGVMILHFKQPDAPRKFKVPLGPYVFPPLGLIMCGVLVYSSSGASLLRLLIWMAIGMIIYFCYGKWNSRLNNPHKYANEKH
jgi:APA family basic amino acid/polyamine antiporter